MQNRYEVKNKMTLFRHKPGSKSAFRHLKVPFPDVTAFDAVVRSLVMKNPLDCTSYMSGKKNHPPVEKVREMYTAKFVYEDVKESGSGADLRYTILLKGTSTASPLSSRIWQTAQLTAVRSGIGPEQTSSP
jgi:hypothetical protein